MIDKKVQFSLDRWKQSPLMDVINCKRIDLINKIILHYFDELKISFHNMGSQLCEYSFNKDLESMHLLNLCGCDLSQPDYDGRTALHVAIAQGWLEGVNALCEVLTGDQINLKDRRKCTPLKEAVLKRRHDFIRILRNKGMSLDKDVDLTKQ